MFSLTNLKGIFHL